MGQYVKQGLVSDSRILDIKHVDISTGKLLENNVPVFLVTFASQEQLVFRSAKTGEVVVGSERDVEQCRYAMVLTRLEAEMENELTGGWKVVEVSLERSLYQVARKVDRMGSTATSVRCDGLVLMCRWPAGAQKVTCDFGQAIFGGDNQTGTHAYTIL
jgi:hypothetical protein